LVKEAAVGVATEEEAMAVDMVGVGEVLVADMEEEVVMAMENKFELL
jgi:hypothetical protein